MCEFENEFEKSTDITFAIVGHSNVAGFKEILKFAKDHGNIVFKKMKPTWVKLYITTGQPGD